MHRFPLCLSLRRARRASRPTEGTTRASMITAGPNASGNQRRGTPLRANRARFSTGALQPEARPPFARRGGDLPLPKPAKGAMVAAKLLPSGEFRLDTTVLLNASSCYDFLSQWRGQYQMRAHAGQKVEKLDIWLAFVFGCLALAAVLWLA